MFARCLAFVAAAAMAAAPCAAADLTGADTALERRTGASAGLYFAVPFGGPRSGRAQGGLRMGMHHDYRDVSGRTVRAAGANTLELRFVGERQPTLFVADRRVTGRNNRQNLLGGGIIGIAVIGLAVVGALVIYNELDDDGDEGIPNQ